MQSRRTRVAVAQVGSILFDTARTLEKVERYCREAKAAGAALTVFPEALLGGYPKGITFGAAVMVCAPGYDPFRANAPRSRLPSRHETAVLQQR